MIEPDDELAAAVRSFAGRARSGQELHYAPEDLLAYHEGQLSRQDNERVRDHLAVCPQCADLILDVADFPPLEPGMPAGDLARRWASLGERLRDEEGPQRRGRAVFLLFRPPARALAASLLLASVGLGAWAVALHRQLARASEPAVRVHVTSLVPQEMAAERAERGAEPVAVPAWADRILLILNVFEPRSYSAYEVAIFDAEQGEKVWSSRELRRAADGNFACEVPRSFLPAGRYRIELNGLAGARRDRLGTYALLLQFE